MKKSLTALEAVERRFNDLQNSRPSEMDGATGFEELNYSLFEDLFSDWHKALTALAATTWAETPIAGLADIGLAKKLSELATLLANAKQHGTVWALTNGFPERSFDVGQTITQLSDRRAGIVKHIAKDLAKRGVEEVAAIVESAPLVEELQARVNEANNALDALRKETVNAGELTSQVTSSAQSLASLQNEISEAHKYFISTRNDVARLHGEMDALRSGTDSKTLDLEKHVAEAKTSAEDAQKTLEEATEALRTALSDVKKTGLAEAFTARAKKVLDERSIWLFIFVAAAFGLVLASQTFAADLETFTYEALLIAFLRRAALAAPLIWIGWYAAKQVGRLNRVHEDYEYKAATALAFESYRSAVAASDDESLMKDLLGSTIKNFGDNPVRLYDGKSDDHATPTEQLLAQLETDKTISLIKKISSILPTVGKPS